MSTVLDKPTQPAAPITPGAAPVAAPGATSTTMNEQQKKIFIIVGAVAGFLVLFGIVYGVLSSAVFSAKSVANSYVPPSPPATTTRPTPSPILTWIRTSAHC